MEIENNSSKCSPVSSSELMFFISFATARGRCWLMLYTQMSRLHFLAFQVADSSQWHVELFARELCASQTQRRACARAHTHKHTAPRTHTGSPRVRAHKHSDLCCVNWLAVQSELWRSRQHLTLLFYVCCVIIRFTVTNSRHFSFEFINYECE